MDNIVRDLIMKKSFVTNEKWNDIYNTLIFYKFVNKIMIRY